jgi:hypothetical protein
LDHSKRFAAAAAESRVALGTLQVQMAWADLEHDRLQPLSI